MAMDTVIVYFSDYDQASLPSGGHYPVAINTPLTAELLPELHDDNYIFQGWYSTPIFSPESRVAVGTIVAGEGTTLYAKWVPKPALNKKMTALADEIREFSGTTTAKGVDEMTSDVNAANTEIAEQAELLVQITTALEGKASGSGGIEVCTMTIEMMDNPQDPETYGVAGLEFTDEKGEIKEIEFESAGTYEVSCAKNTACILIGVDPRSVTVSSTPIGYPSSDFYVFFVSEDNITVRAENFYC